MSKELQDQVNDLAKIAALSESEGGRLVADAFLRDVVMTLKLIAGHYRTLTHTEFIAHAASLSEKLEVLSILYGAAGDYDAAAEDLKATLKEDMQ
jgi:hypothetical protein